MAEPPPLPLAEPPSRMEMALSWFVFPGAGQCLQRRYIAAGLFGVPSMGACTVLFIEVIRPMVLNFIALFRIMNNETDWEVTAPSIPVIVATFVVVLVMFLFSGVDATFAYRRRMTRWNLQILAEKMKP